MSTTAVEATELIMKQSGWRPATADIGASCPFGSETSAVPHGVHRRSPCDLSMPLHPGIPDVTIVTAKTSRLAGGDAAVTGPRGRTGGAEEPDGEDSLRPGSEGLSARRVLFLAVVAIVSFGCLLGVWLGLAGAVDVEDLTAGAAASALAIGIGFVLSHSGRAVPRLRAGDVARIARFPVQLVVESAQVFLVAARKAAHRDAPGGCWAEVPVDVAGTGWAAAQRQSVVTALMSATPKTVVADVNLSTGTALVHRLGGGDQAARSASEARP